MLMFAATDGTQLLSNLTSLLREVVEQVTATMAGTGELYLRTRFGGLRVGLGVDWRRYSGLQSGSC